MKILMYGDIGGSGGYIRYCKGLLGSGAIPGNLDIWFIASMSLSEKLGPLDPKIHIITHPWIDSKNRWYRYLWHLWVYPGIVRSIRPDVEFYPSGQLRVYWRSALTISTCHNLLLFDSKELKLVKDKKEQQSFQVYRKNQAKSFQKSDAVIFLSSHSQRIVCGEVDGIKQSTVIGHGLDPIFHMHQKRSYCFGKRICLLYVSPVFQYKHQIEVIQAVEMLRKETGLDICLKLIGGGSRIATNELKQFVFNRNANEFVTIIGPLEYELLLKEYSSADIFIFASSCETFGITILEAMGFRLPIACSDRTGLPDILKDAGVYFDPQDPNSIAGAIKKLILDTELRKTLGERAYGYSLEYSWQKCASETFEYIKQVKRSSAK